MEDSFYSEERYFKAKKRFEKIKAFYGHLVIYFCVIPVVILINLKYTPEFQWFWYSVIGGGIPLLIHALKVFVFNGNWEEKKIQEILKKEEIKKVCK
jgi:uncharacterized protein YhhL (DUF1145 family)